MPMRPKKIKVGPYTLDVEFRKKGTPAKKDTEKVGETYFAKLFMWIKKGPHDLESETTLHETLHAIFAAAEIGLAYKQEEELVCKLSPWLLMTLRDNPELVEYLLKD